MLANALIQRLTSVGPQHGLRYTEHISPLVSGLKRRCCVRDFSRLFAAGRKPREVIGIDFGTANCRVAFMDNNGNPTMIKIADEKICMPSVVSFGQNGKAIVGGHPKDVISDKNIFGIKRLIGRSYVKDCVELQKLKKMIPYEMILPDSEKEKRKEARIKLTDGKKCSFTDIAACIFEKLIEETAKFRDGVYASHVVVSVPPFFQGSQCEAVRCAADQVVCQQQVYVNIDEPTADSLYYKTKINSEKGCLAVIDLGGGSFDVSIVNESNDRWGPGIKTIATKHADSVAGVEFDHAMTELLLKRLEREKGGKIHQLGLSPHSLVVRREVERAKIEFFSSSALQSRIINLDVRCVPTGVGDRLEICLQRSEFEDSMQEMIFKVKDLCWSCLEEANLKPEQVDEVILVGGMSRVPRVWDIVEEIFGRKPSEEVNPDGAVSLGAAIWANRIANP